MEILKKIIINAFSIALTISLAIGLLVGGAYAISTLNKNFTSGSQLQAQDLQDMVNKINELTNKLNQVEGTANSAYSTANSVSENSTNALNIATSVQNRLNNRYYKFFAESACTETHSGGRRDGDCSDYESIRYLVIP